jgi:hypothetical protein
MSRALGLIGVVFGISLLEGLWCWLFVAAISEVTGQISPPIGLITMVVFTSWLGARLLTIANIDPVHRRWALVGGGLLLAFLAGTVHAGLVMPFQLIFGTYTPDLRGAGMALVLAVLYLWGRGLLLLGPITRERVMNHIVVASAGLAAVLVFLPLTEVVREYGLGMVVVEFIVGLATLLLVQLAGVESRKLTPLQWTGVGAGAATLLVVGASLVTGVFTSGGMSVVGRGLGSVGRAATPVVNVFLLAAGYLTEYLYYLFRWVATIFQGDPEAVDEAVRQAEAERPQVEFEPGAAPELLSAIVGIFVIALILLIVALIYVRLLRHGSRDGDEVVEETRTSTGGPGLRAMLRGALDQLRRRGGEASSDDDPRLAIRRAYRTVQTLMARAGLPRALSQTPREFEAALGAEIPEARRPLAILTDAYVLARYADDRAHLPASPEIDRTVDELRDALREHDRASTAAAALGGSRVTESEADQNGQD